MSEPNGAGPYAADGEDADGQSFVAAEHDERAAELLRAIFSGGAIVCLTKCWPCMCDQCPGYDPEGRPYIHASWDEDETEEVVL